MSGWRRRWIAVVPLVGVLAVGCNGDDGGDTDDGTAEDGGAAPADGDDAADGEVDGTEDGPTAGGGDVEVPEGWQLVTFPRGGLAVPGDWTEQPPIADDDATWFGPDAADGTPGMVVRVRVTDRDQAPFEELPSLFGASLTFQAGGDVDPVGEEPIEVAGAEEAVVATYRYEDADGEVALQIEERVVIAWFAEDRQLQIRLAGTVDMLETEGELLDEIARTISLGGPEGTST